MHAVKKRGGSALLLTRCCMKRKTEYKILNQKKAEKKGVQRIYFSLRCKFYNKYQENSVWPK